MSIKKVAYKLHQTVAHSLFKLNMCQPVYLFYPKGGLRCLLF
jgi:hypothetical protein